MGADVFLKSRNKGHEIEVLGTDSEWVDAIFKRFPEPIDVFREYGFASEEREEKEGVVRLGRNGGLLIKGNEWSILSRSSGEKGYGGGVIQALAHCIFDDATRTKGKDFQAIAEKVIPEIVKKSREKAMERKHKRTGRNGASKAKGEKKDDSPKWFWKTADEAAREFEKLPLANDDKKARNFFLKEYGLHPDGLPDDWRIGTIWSKRGIVYRYQLPGQADGYKFKPFARNERGKRQPCYISQDFDGGLWRVPGGGNGLVVVAGEEKARAAFLAGYDAVFLRAGEKSISSYPAVERFILETNPPEVIFPNDADDPGDRANKESAKRLVEIGYPASRIKRVDWPKDAPKGHDLNDVLKVGGVEAVAELLENAEPWLAHQGFKLWTLDEVFQFELDERDNYLGDYLVQASAMTPLLGPPDVGKSRVIIQLIVSALTGRADWLGFPIHRHDLKIMFLQTENSIRRLKHDLGAMLRGCCPDARAEVNMRLRLFIPQSVDETVLGLDDAAVVARLKATVQRERPDLVIVDPVGDFYAGDNENDAIQMRTTCKLLLGIARSANEKTAIIPIHHARSGKTAAANADGWERSAYGRGSKALISIARAAINLAPADEHDSGAIIVACGKSNDGPRFPAFGIRLDPETMTYSRDEEIDIEAWRETVKGEKKRGPQKAVSVELTVSALNALGGKAKKKDLVAELIRLTKCASSTAYDAISRAHEKNAVLAAAGHVMVTNGGNAK